MNNFFVGFKLPTDLVRAAKQQAEADDRSLSAYLRRIITAAVERNTTEPRKEDGRG